MRRIWFRHVIIGVPLAALLFTVVQTAYAYVPGEKGASHSIAMFLLALLVGALILIPAYTLQAFASAGLGRLGVGRAVQIGVGAAIQASLVAAWAGVFGMSPSLRGNFPLMPVMLGAAVLAGSVVAALAAPPRVRPTGENIENTEHYD